jgi:hypothetical protein
MIHIRNRYTAIGLTLVFGGSFFGLVSTIIIDYMPLTALAITSVILGIVSWGLGRTLPRISLDTAQLIFQAGLDNIFSLIEEIGINSPAVYLPKSVANGKTLVPLNNDDTSLNLPPRLEQRLLVQRKSGGEVFGLLITTPGSLVLTTTAIEEDGTAGGLESALNSIMVGNLDLAEGVKVPGGQTIWEIEVVNPSLNLPVHSSEYLLGSPIASIVAAVAAEVLSVPITIVEEKVLRGRLAIKLRLHEEVSQ